MIDRVKDIARTSGGARFSPQFVENKLKFSPFVGECVVLGQGRPHLAAILCLRYSMVAKWAEARKIAFTTYQSLAGHPEILGLLAAEVEKVNASLPEPQRLRRFLSLYKEFSLNERFKLRMNLDAFNAFNIQGLVNPNSSDGIQSLQQSYWTPRQIQLTARLSF